MLPSSLNWLDGGFPSWRLEPVSPQTTRTSGQLCASGWLLQQSRACFTLIEAAFDTDWLEWPLSLYVDCRLFGAPDRECRILHCIEGSITVPSVELIRQAFDSERKTSRGPIRGPGATSADLALAKSVTCWLGSNPSRSAISAFRAHQRAVRRIRRRGVAAPGDSRLTAVRTPSVGR